MEKRLKNMKAKTAFSSFLVCYEHNIQTGYGHLCSFTILHELPSSFKCFAQEWSIHVLWSSHIPFNDFQPIQTFSAALVLFLCQKWTQKICQVVISPLMMSSHILLCSAIRSSTGRKSDNLFLYLSHMQVRLHQVFL